MHAILYDASYWCIPTIVYWSEILLLVLIIKGTNKMDFYLKTGFAGDRLGCPECPGDWCLVNFVLSGDWLSWLAVSFSSKRNGINTWARMSYHLLKQNWYQYLHEPGWADPQLSAPVINTWALVSWPTTISSSSRNGHTWSRMIWSAAISSLRRTVWYSTSAFLPTFFSGVENPK